MEKSNEDMLINLTRKAFEMREIEPELPNDHEQGASLMDFDFVFDDEAADFKSTGKNPNLKDEQNNICAEADHQSAYNNFGEMGTLSQEGAVRKFESQHDAYPYLHNAFLENEQQIEHLHVSQSMATLNQSGINNQQKYPNSLLLFPQNKNSTSIGVGVANQISPLINQQQQTNFTSQTLNTTSSLMWPQLIEVTTETEASQPQRSQVVPSIPNINYDPNFHYSRETGFSMALRSEKNIHQFEKMLKEGSTRTKEASNSEPTRILNSQLFIDQQRTLKRKASSTTRDTRQQELGESSFSLLSSKDSKRSRNLYSIRNSIVSSELMSWINQKKLSSTTRDTQQQELCKSLSKRSRSKEAAESTLLVPNTPNISRQIKNAVYDPIFEALGLPIDPHLRLFNKSNS